MKQSEIDILSDADFIELAAQALYLEARQARIFEAGVINALCQLFGEGD